MSVKIKKYFFPNLKFKTLLIILLSLLFILERNISLSQSDVTIVSALFYIKSKHSINDYMKWVKNFLSINAHIVFFIDRNLSQVVKKLRPKIFKNKTVWIETDIFDLFSYKKYHEEFEKDHLIDPEKNIHTTLLYIVWAEKCNFVKRAIEENYFKSKCFYWVDAGYFRDDIETKKYSDYWPSSKKCFEDPRVIMNSIRNLSKEEILGLQKLDLQAYNNNFVRRVHVEAGIFDRNMFYMKEFILKYYQTIDLFIKNHFFIGKDQNLFAYIAYLNTNIVNLIYSGNWFFFQFFLSTLNK